MAMMKKLIIAGMMATTLAGTIPAFAQDGWRRGRDNGSAQTGERGGDRGGWNNQPARSAPQASVPAPTRAPSPNIAVGEPNPNGNAAPRGHVWGQERTQDRRDWREARQDWRQDRREDRRDDRRDWRNDRQDNRQDNRQDWRNAHADWRNNDHRDNGRRDWDNNRSGWHTAPGVRSSYNWDNRWRQDRRYDWRDYRDHNRDRYRANRYYAPRGWDRGYSRFSIGISIGSPFYGRNYWIDDPYSYRLPPAYGALRWVRYYDDAVLVDIRSGYVVDIIYDFFW